MTDFATSLADDIIVPRCGGMAEWLKAAVLKTVVPQGTVGSNPTSSASLVFYKGAS